jgi:hypothetical protein
LPLAGIDGLLHDALVGAGIDAATVHLAHRRLGEQAGTPGDPAQVEHQPGKERDSDHHHERFGRIAKGLHHRTIRGSNPKDSEEAEA